MGTQKQKQSDLGKSLDPHMQILWLFIVNCMHCKCQAWSTDSQGGHPCWGRVPGQSFTREINTKVNTEPRVYFCTYIYVQYTWGRKKLWTSVCFRWAYKAPLLCAFTLTVYLPQKIIEFKSTVWSYACRCRQVNLTETHHQRCIRKLMIANSMLATRKGLRENNTISLWRMEKMFFSQEKINRQSWEGISRAHIHIYRWYAGASLELETNKGRIFSFHPHLATRVSCTLAAL